MKTTITLAVFIFLLFNTSDAKSQGCVPGRLGDCLLSSLSNAGSKGIYDPSIADTPSGTPAYMSFSAVAPSAMWPTQNPATISTFIGTSSNLGVTWTHACSRINAVTDVAGGLPRSWNNEVSSLIYDSLATPSQRWKLFWHHYQIQNNVGQFNNGWIAYKTAPDPCSLASAKEIKLFGGSSYNSDNNIAGGTTGSPVGGAPVLQLNTLSPALSGCVAFTEPGAMVTATGLYLSLNCQQVGNITQIILLRCEAPCNPSTAGGWTYHGMPITHTDATNAGFLNYSASDLFAINNNYYISVTSVIPPNTYNNCQIFEFTNINAATIVRTGALPNLIKQINGTPRKPNGACTYAQAVTKAGFALEEFSGATFQIFLSGSTIQPFIPKAIKIGH